MEKPEDKGTISGRPRYGGEIQKVKNKRYEEDKSKRKWQKTEDGESKWFFYFLCGKALVHVAQATDIKHSRFMFRKNIIYFYTGLVKYI